MPMSPKCTEHALPNPVASFFDRHNYAMEGRPSCEETSQRLVVVGLWTGREARVLRVALRMTIEAFAEHLGVAVRTVAKWEAQGTGIVPIPAIQDVLDVALQRATSEQQARFEILRAGDQTGKEKSAKDDKTKRRDLLKLGLAAPSAALAERITSALERPARVGTQLLEGLHQQSAALGRAYHGVPADALIDPARQHVDTIVRLTKCSMTDGDRKRLCGIGADAASLAGSVYLLLDQQGDAQAYLKLAEGLAHESENLTLQAGVLGAMSRMYSPTEGAWAGGEPAEALALVERANELASQAPAPMRAWLGGRTAIEHASSGHPSSSDRALDEARRILSEDSGEPGPGGFFGSFLSVRDQSHLTSLEGLCHVLLHRGDRAETTLLAALSEVSPERTRLPIILLSDLAAAYIIQDSPEQASQSLADAHELATCRGYLTGIQRIRSVRARMPASWADLPSIQELDERLAV
jgi:transcriptional regulator with XRE-family HTH domain